MTYRLLALILILAAPCFAAAEYDTLRDTLSVDDVQITDTVVVVQSTAYRNYGSAVAIGLSEIANAKRRGLIRMKTSALQSQVPTSNRVLRARYYFKTPLFIVPATISAYQVYRSWSEGNGSGAATSFMSQGASWNVYDSPTRPDTTSGTLPTSINWAESSYVSSIKDQGSCQTCWSFAPMAALEAVYKKEVYVGTKSPNSEDSSGADRAICAMNPNADVTTITGTGWKRYTWTKQDINRAYSRSGWDNGFVLVADSGNITINTTENGTNPPRRWVTFVSKEDGLYTETTARITASSFFDALIDSANPTTNAGTATTANITPTKLFFFRPDSLRALVNALLPTDDTLVEFISCIDSFYVSSVTSNASVKPYLCFKAHWLEDQITWNVWKTNYEWGRAGASTYNELDLAEQQVLSCIDEITCSSGGYMDRALTYVLESGDSILTEAKLPYTGNDVDCPNTDTLPQVTMLKWFYQYGYGTTARHLKQLVLMKPVPIYMIWQNPEFVNYVYDYNVDKCYYSTAASDGTHAMLLVGYDDNFICDAGEGTGAWIVKNQYGTDWGLDGYGYIAYGNGTWSGILQSIPSAYVLDYQHSPSYWSTPGLGSGTDRATTPFAQTSISADNTWYYIEIPTWLAQGWLNGTIPNNGFMVTTSNTSSSNSWQVSEATDLTAQAFFEILSEPTTTYVGPGNYGNSNIGK